MMISISIEIEKCCIYNNFITKTPFVNKKYRVYNRFLSKYQRKHRVIGKECSDTFSEIHTLT